LRFFLHLLVTDQWINLSQGRHAKRGGKAQRDFATMIRNRPITDLLPKSRPSA